MLSKINVDRVVEKLREAMTELPFDDKEEEIRKVRHDGLSFLKTEGRSLHV